MTAFNQHGLAARLEDDARRLLRAVHGLDGNTCQRLSLAQVGGNERGQWQQALFDAHNRFRFKQFEAAGGDQHRIYNEVRRAVFGEFRGDGVDYRPGRQHPGFYRGDVEVIENRVDLRFDEIHRQLEGFPDLPRVLRGHSRDNGEAVGAVGVKGLEVGLDAGAAAGVGSGNGEDLFHESCG